MASTVLNGNDRLRKGHLLGRVCHMVKYIQSSPLNNDLQPFKDWIYKNHLLLNFEKTEFLAIGSTQEIKTSELCSMDIEIDSIVTTHTELLGIILDHNINWTSHISNLIKK
jgi:hypothetical protein